MGKCGPGEVLLTLNERMARKRHIIRIASKNKQTVNEGLQALQKHYGKMFHQAFRMAISGNASEFSGLAEALKGVGVYFAHHYSYLECGTNKKQNSMVRHFIPKGQDIGRVSDYTIQKTEDFINDLPLEMFDCRTTRELFNEQIALL